MIDINQSEVMGIFLSFYLWESPDLQVKVLNIPNGALTFTL